MSNTSPSLELSYLETADRIGSRLCREAQWDGSRCNWMTWLYDPISQAPHFRALGSNPIAPVAGLALYEGITGIGLFLARLFQYSHEQIRKETAIGCVNQAIALAPSPEPTVEFGAYDGLCGIAYAFIEIGQLIEHESLTRHGLELFDIDD